MTMTPQDIQSQQFHVRFRGFDVEEVDSFLERVAEEYLILMEENRQLNEQLEAVKKEIDSFHSREKSFQKAIMSAQQIVDEMKARSRKEAEEMITAAREEAHQLNADARAEVATLKNEVEHLQKMKIEARQELQQTLYGYLAFLEEGADSGSTGKDRQEDSRTASVEGPESEVDLDDLYENIDLPDEEVAAAMTGDNDRMPEMTDDSDGLFKMEGVEAEVPESTVPDLEGDMLFTLEDPLDEEGPAITFEFDNDAEEQRKTG